MVRLARMPGFEANAVSVPPRRGRTQKTARPRLLVFLFLCANRTLAPRTLRRSARAVKRTQVRRPRLIERGCAVSVIRGRTVGRPGDP